MQIRDQLQQILILWRILDGWGLLVFVLQEKFPVFVFRQNESLLWCRGSRGLKTIAQKTVTYDFERLMEGATLLKTSEFAQAMVRNMG